LLLEKYLLQKNSNWPRKFNLRGFSINKGSVLMPDQRLKQTEFAAWMGIIITLLLAVMKGSVGLLSHSRALIADAVYSASGAVGSMVIRIGSRAAKKSLHEDPPYTSGKTEAAAAIIVSMLFLVVGVEIGISAVKTIIRGVSDPPEGIAVIALVVSISAKEAMFRYKYALGKKIANQALIASAWEHRTDMYASFIALAGVTGALIAQSLVMKSFYIFDTIASFFIALLLIKMGYKRIMESIHSSIGLVIQPSEAAELMSTVLNIKGVITVDELRAREHGHYVLVDVKISVNPKISVYEGHDIARLVKQQLMKRFTHVSDVFIHVNPYDPGYPYKNNVDPDQDENASLLH
jgi:cation diffusion facilitator family transporter